MNQWANLSSVSMAKIYIHVFYFFLSFSRLRSPISCIRRALSWLSRLPTPKIEFRERRSRVALTRFSLFHFDFRLAPPLLFANVKYWISKRISQEKEQDERTRKLLFDFSFRFVWISFLFFLRLWPKMICIFINPLEKRFDLRSVGCWMARGASACATLLTKCQIFHKMHQSRTRRKRENEQEKRNNNNMSVDFSSHHSPVPTPAHTFGITHWAHWSARESPTTRRRWTEKFPKIYCNCFRWIFFHAVCRVRIAWNEFFPRGPRKHTDEIEHFFFVGRIELELV